MGFLDEIKKLTRPYDEDYDDFDEEDYGVETTTEPSQNPFSSFGTETASQSRQAATAPKVKRDGKVVNLSSAGGSKVVLLKPERFEQASKIADHLREMRTIVINLETTPKDVSRRLLDFLSGVAYALDGKVKRISASTFIITPSNIDLMGDLADELESGSFTF